MRMSISISRTLIGMGVASALFLGCQQLAGRDDASSGNPDVTGAGAVSDFDLALRVKPTEECLALQELLLAADSAGETSLTVEGDFVKLCLEEVKPGPDGAIHIPPGLVPPKPSRCKWLVSQVDSGNSEYIVKLLYNCPEPCDTALADTVKGHCPVPRPKPDCPSLIARFDTLDTASREYSKLKHFLHHHCGIIDPDHPVPPARDTLLPPPPPPRDTLPPPPPREPTLCDSIHVGLAGLDKTSDEYAALKEQHDAVCHIPPPPKDTLPPPPEP